MPWRLVGPGAGTTNRPGTTCRVVNTEAHDRPASDIAPGCPWHTGVAVGTPRLVGGPIHDEGLSTIASAGLMWLARGAKGWTDHRNLVQALGTGQALRVHIATLESMRARAEIPLGSILLKRRAHDTVGRRRRGRDRLGEQSGRPGITGLAPMGLIADPGRVACGAVARLQIIRRLDRQGRWRPLGWAAPAPFLQARRATAIVWWQPQLAEHLQPRQRLQMAGVRWANDRLHQGLPVGPHVHGQGVAWAGVGGQASGGGPQTVAGIPLRGDLWPPPGRISRTKLLESRMPCVEDPFEPVAGPNGREPMGRIRPLGAARLDPAPGFAGGAEGSQEPLGGVMGEPAFPNIVQPGEVTPGVVSVEAQRLWPLQAAADGIGRLAGGEPCAIRHPEDQSPAPGGHFHRTPLGGREIRQELIRVARATRCPQSHSEVALGEGGPHRSRRHVWNGGEGLRTSAQAAPPCTTITRALTTRRNHHLRARSLASATVALCDSPLASDFPRPPSMA